jgi:phosphohistidine phosphatase
MTSAADDRIIVLLRHAEAQDPVLGAADIERELTSAGSLQAEDVGAWLHDLGIGFDTVLCSSSTRTQQTAEGVWSGGCAETDVHVDSRLYNASAQAILDVIRETDEDDDVILVIGHAPGLPTLASALADGEGSGEAHDGMARGFPPAALAVLRYSGHWRDLSPDAAVLERFHVGVARERDGGTEG